MQRTVCQQQLQGARHAAAPAAGGRAARLAGAPPLQRRQHWRRQQQQRGDALVAASEPQQRSGYKSEAEETTEKYGLEAGLFKVLTSKGGGEGAAGGAGAPSKAAQAKALLARYGSAYLITSISFAIVSMTACYLAVDAGVDVAGLLQRVGLQVTDRSETVGTFAIAYAAHKALSPVRFPPTVALTPLVAKWLGKEPALEEGAASE